MPIVNIFAKSYMRGRLLIWIGLGWGRLGGERGAERFSFGQIEVELGEEESLKGGMRTTRDHNSASALVEDSNTD